jgi:nucleoside-diphosphate-sugar epimerase
MIYVGRGEPRADAKADRCSCSARASARPTGGARRPTGAARRCARDRRWTSTPRPSATTARGALRRARRREGLSPRPASPSSIVTRGGGGDLGERRANLANLRAGCGAPRRARREGQARPGGAHALGARRACVSGDVRGRRHPGGDGGNTTIWAQFFHEVRSDRARSSGHRRWACSARACRRRSALRSRAPAGRSTASSETGRWAFIRKRSRRPCATSLPVIYLVLCDKQWGMVKINQQFALKPVKTLVFKTLGPDETINTELGEIEFDALARSMGAHGERVARPRGSARRHQRSLASGKPAVIHVDVDPVKHMWAPELKTFKDMHQEPALVTARCSSPARAGYVGRKLVARPRRRARRVRHDRGHRRAPARGAPRRRGVRDPRRALGGASRTLLTTARDRHGRPPRDDRDATEGHVRARSQYDVDVLGTENVLAACVDGGRSRLVVTSSGAAYGYHADSPPLLDEDRAAARQRGVRLRAPQAARRRASRARAREHPALEQLIFRPGTILGAGAKNQITDIFDATGDHRAARVRDARSSFVLGRGRGASDRCAACATGWTGIYNLAGDGVLTLREIAARSASASCRCRRARCASRAHAAAASGGAHRATGPSRRRSSRTARCSRTSACAPSGVRLLPASREVFERGCRARLRRARAGARAGATARARRGRDRRAARGIGLATAVASPAKARAWRCSTVTPSV